MVSPLGLLVVLVALTCGSYFAWKLQRMHRRSQMRAKALGWGMQYVHADRFNLASRIVGVFPVPGAADVRVADVIYGVEGGRQRWLFTVEYTEGVIGRQRRIRRAATFCEPRDVKSGRTCAGVQLGPEELPLGEQYRVLHRQGSERAGG